MGDHISVIFRMISAHVCLNQDESAKIQAGDPGAKKWQVTAVDCDSQSLEQLRQRSDKVKIVQMDMEEMIRITD